MHPSKQSFLSSALSYHTPSFLAPSARHSRLGKLWYHCCPSGPQSQFSGFPNVARTDRTVLGETKSETPVRCHEEGWGSTCNPWDLQKFSLCLSGFLSQLWPTGPSVWAGTSMEGSLHVRPRLLPPTCCCFQMGEGRMRCGDCVLQAQM